MDLNDCNFSKQAGPEIASALSKQTNLEVLLIRDANLGDAGIKAILDALSSSTTSKLSKLDMSGNDLTERGWKHLTATLKKPAFAMLTELSVDDCELESELACAFAATLLHLTHLKSLHLCQCALQAGGAVAIATAVSRLSSFRDLKLEDNAINSSALAHIEKLFESTGKVLVPLEENDGDGEDDLEDHQESIDELMGPVINSVDTSVDALAGQLSVAKI